MAASAGTTGDLTGSVRRPAHPALRDLVTPYVGYSHVGLGAGVHHGLPSTDLTVVLALDDPLDVAWAGDAGSRARHWALVSGLDSRPALIRYDGRQHGIQFGLTPLGARLLLGVPAGELRKTLAPLEALVGPVLEPAYDAVAGASSWADRFDVLDRHLCRWAATRRGRRSEIRGELDRAWRRLHDTQGAVRVETLAQEVGWSRRHLAARFGAEYGLGPKQVGRLVRFQRSRQLLLQPGARAADVAGECGYADQAHLTREWRELAGYPPREWRRAEVAFLQD
jgi:AraC-like DNA-binding protein